MTGALRIAASISTMWSLAAFAIAIVAFLFLKQKGKISSAVWGALAAIVLLGLVPIVGSLYASLEKEKIAERRDLDRDRAMYELRVVVRRKADGSPIDEALVKCSLGITPAKANGAWEFKIPAKLQPGDGKVTVSAELPQAFLSGFAEIALADDFQPAATVWLQPLPSASVRGIVLDGDGAAVVGARVSVIGYKDEFKTLNNGQFELPAHAADGQEVMIHVEKEGFSTINQSHLAGDFPATLVLHRLRSVR